MKKKDYSSSDNVENIINTLRVSSELAMSGFSNNLADSLLLATILIITANIE